MILQETYRLTLVVGSLFALNVQKLKRVVKIQHLVQPDHALGLDFLNKSPRFQNQHRPIGVYCAKEGVPEAVLRKLELGTR